MEKKKNNLFDQISTVAVTMLVLATIALVCIQAGISKGRNIQSLEDCIEYGSEIDSLQEENEKLKRELKHWKLVNEIIKYESSHKHENIWGDGGDSYGIAQFKKSTFYELAQKAGMKNAEWKNKKDQIILLSWAVRNGYGRLWTGYRLAMQDIK